MNCPISSHGAGNHQQECGAAEKRLIHMADSQSIWIYDRAKRRSSVDHPTDYYFSLAEDALERPRV